MNTDKMFSLNWGDVGKGLVMAVLGGVALPVLAALQTPGFDILHANWSAVASLALNGGIAAFAGYLIKNFFSSDNKFLGKVG